MVSVTRCSVSCDAIVAAMTASAPVRDKELRRKLTPDYDFGCKRPTWSNSYYRTFTKPHVHLETNSIERIEPDGIVTADGHKTVIDTLVLATGFDLWDANFPAIEVIGRQGRNLGKWWRENRFQAYQGMSIPYFPNYLSLASPYGFCGLSVFNNVEYQMRHMDRLFGELQRVGASEFEGDGNSKQTLPGSDDRASGGHAVLRRQLRHLAVVLLQQQWRSEFAAAYANRGRSTGSIELSVERLRDPLTWPDTACAVVNCCIGSTNRRDVRMDPFATHYVTQYMADDGADITIDRPADAGSSVAKPMVLLSAEIAAVHRA